MQKSVWYVFFGKILWGGSGVVIRFKDLKGRLYLKEILDLELFRVRSLLLKSGRDCKVSKELGL